MLVGVTVGRSRSRNAARLVLPIAFLLLENIVSTVLKGACAGPMRSVEFGILSANKSAEHIMLMGGTYQSVATVDVCLVARETPTTSVYQAATTPLGSHPHPSIGGRHPSILSCYMDPSFRLRLTWRRLTGLISMNIWAAFWTPHPIDTFDTYG